MKHISTIIIIFAVALSAMLFTECNRRDPQAEYESLCSMFFTDPLAGFNKAKEYLDYFYGETGCRTKEVTDIKNKYKEMSDFFTNHSINYSDFMVESADINREMSVCPYEGIQKTWRGLYEKEKRRLIRPLIEQITEQKFDEFFQEQIKKVCNQRYDNLSIQSVDRLDISSPVIKADGVTKECNGRYCVHAVKRYLSIAKSPKEVEVDVKGEIRVDETGGFNTKLVSYTITKEP